MALRVAVASGNWSNPVTWNGGVLPTAGDVVASNNFTVTIDQNINVDSLTNAVASVATAIPVMTSNTSPSGIASASNITSGTYDAFKAFDANSGTWWGAGTVGAGNPKWVSYEFSTAKAIDKYYIQGVNNGTEQGPKDWEFQGWNGTSWITLHTVTGNTTTYTSPLIGNSTAYIKYRLYVTLGQNTNLGIINLEMYEYLGTTAAVAGGTFNINSGVTVTCTNTGDGITQVANTACVTVNTTGNPTINANIRGRDGSTVRCVRKTGTGNLTINGTLRGQSSSSGNGGALEIANTGVVNINGNVFEGPANGSTIYVGSTCTLNIVGDITSGTWNNNFTVDVAANNCQLNITGNIIVGFQSTAGWSATVFRISGSGNTLNVVGNIDSTLGTNVGTSTYKTGLVITGANNNVVHTGNVIGSSDNVSGGHAVNITNTVNYNQVGYIKASMNYFGISSTGATSIHLFTGPFISSPSGVFPFYVFRMHYIITSGSYFEFRDSSTNGALPPSAPAPATRLVSPDTIVDSPIPANVRNGVTYALGSQTGTLKVPLPSQVSKGIETDNTVGTAALTPEDVWNALTSSMTTPGSIGNRLKNTSTVETTGDQIASLL